MGGLEPKHLKIWGHRVWLKPVGLVLQMASQPGMISTSQGTFGNDCRHFWFSQREARWE